MKGRFDFFELLFPNILRVFPGLHMVQPHTISTTNIITQLYQIDNAVHSPCTWELLHSAYHLNHT